MVMVNILNDYYKMVLDLLVLLHQLFYYKILDKQKYILGYQIFLPEFYYDHFSLFYISKINNIHYLNHIEAELLRVGYFSPAPSYLWVL